MKYFLLFIFSLSIYAEKPCLMEKAPIGLGKCIEWDNGYKAYRKKIQELIIKVNLSDFRKQRPYDIKIWRNKLKRIRRKLSYNKELWIKVDDGSCEDIYLNEYGQRLDLSPHKYSHYEEIDCNSNLRRQFINYL